MSEASLYRISSVCRLAAPLYTAGIDCCSNR
jgi:hypothetical protein